MSAPVMPSKDVDRSTTIPQWPSQIGADEALGQCISVDDMEFLDLLGEGGIVSLHALS